LIHSTLTTDVKLKLFSIGEHGHLIICCKPTIELLESSLMPRHYPRAWPIGASSCHECECMFPAVNKWISSWLHWRG